MSNILFHLKGHYTSILTNIDHIINKCGDPDCNDGIGSEFFIFFDVFSWAVEFSVANNDRLFELLRYY